jgi:DNA-directed RNA polymerase specialized sigma24 family protein
MKHYVNNAQLSKVLGEWADLRRDAIKNGTLIPELPSEVGEASLLIATRMATKVNFSKYTWVEDLVGAALLSIVSYCGSFDLKKSENAFSFLTQIAHHSFIRQIHSENKHSYISAQLFMQQVSRNVSDQQMRQNHSHENLLTRGHEIIERFETRLAKKNEKNTARIAAAEEKLPVKVKRHKKSCTTS